MEIGGHGGVEMAMPISTSFSTSPAGNHHHHHIQLHVNPQLPKNHIHVLPPVQSAAPIAIAPPSTTINGTHSPTSLISTHDQYPYMTKNKSQAALVVKYKECLKNHAAAMGGNATDGCGEFMPSGSEGTLDALKCSACNCHRNFHRKETDHQCTVHDNNNITTTSPSPASPCDQCNFHVLKERSTGGAIRKVGGAGKGLLISSASAHDHQSLIHGYTTNGNGIISAAARPSPQNMIMSSYNVAGSESDEQEGIGAANGGGHNHHLVPRPLMVKKRFRTKFSQEQKEKMLRFAEKVGWRIQKQEEGVVQQLCQEIGVKRRVLKVWMHNNKHNLQAKRSSIDHNQNQSIGGGAAAS